MEKTNTTCYDWTKFRQSDVYENIVSRWEDMLEDTSLKEQAYQQYLQEHPAVFLTYEECYLVISRLKLSSEYETDFVAVKEL